MGGRKGGVGREGEGELSRAVCADGIRVTQERKTTRTATFEAGYDAQKLTVRPTCMAWSTHRWRLRSG